MKRTRKTLVLIVGPLLLAALLFGSLGIARAGTVSDFGIRDAVAGSTCPQSGLDVQFKFTGTTDDGSSKDIFGVNFTDANGVPIGAETRSTTVGSTLNHSVATGLNIINDITAFPVTVTIHDLTSVLIGPTPLQRYNHTAAAPEIARLTITLGDVPALATVCADYVLKSPSPTSNGVEPFFQTSVPAQSIDAFKAADVPLPDGRMPLAIFEPHWWGVKTLNSTHFPAVTDWTQAEVYCLDSGGNWTGEYVSTWSESEAVLQVYVKQHGICGIFPKA